MASTRLPGKTMLQVDGWPMLAIMIERVMLADLVDTVVVATPEGSENEPIWSFLERGGSSVKLVKGPEDDVLSRVLKAAKETQTDVIVELTGDCPLIDPDIIDLCTGYFHCGEWDFVGNIKPRSWPRGMDVRVFSTKTLERVDKEVTGHPREAYWREHVSPWMYEGDGKYNLLNIDAPPEETNPELNLSVDTHDDFRCIKEVVESLRPGNHRFSVLGVMQHLGGLPGYEHILLPTGEREAAWLKRV
jgi:spore coat polysaccharide biosynthesis protein SpsF